jgi:hypothetical protein
MPETGFETTNGTSWTTLAQETAFLQAVQAAAGGRMTYSLGTNSYQGRPVYVAVIGSPTPQKTILITSLQHGNEYAGREAALKVIRDLALSEDANISHYLDDHTIIVVPTVNPDGFTASSRNNAQNINLNRDHIKLQSSEIELVQTLMRDWQPEIFIDLHEQWSEGGVTLRTAWQKNPNVDSGLAAYTKALLDTTVASALSAQGYTYGYYTFAETGADYWENVGHNMAGLRHAIGMLFESFATSPAHSRVNSHYVAVMSVIEKHRTDEIDITNLTTSARSRKITEGQQQSRPFDLLNGHIIDPAPLSYFLNATQKTIAAKHIAIFGIIVGGDGYAYMAQAAQPVIPYVFDDDAPHSVIGALRLTSQVPPVQEPSPLKRGVPLSFKVHLGGTTTTPLAVKLKQGGEVFTIWTA